MLIGYSALRAFGDRPWDRAPLSFTLCIRRETISTVLGVVGFLAFMVFGIAQLVSGFAGIEHGLGVGWAWGALIAALMFRFTLPITIGAFFGAMNVWGWHWALAALFVAPGLLLVIPSVLASLFSLVKR